MPVSALTKRDFEPRPFDEAAAAFGRKVPVAAEVFQRLSGPAKARAFAIVNVNKARLIQQVRNLVERAMVRDGKPWREVRGGLIKLFERAGVRMPSLGRLRQSMRHQVLSAYSRARRETLDAPEMVAAFGYRQYLTVGNGTPGINGVRPTHAVLHGKVFAATDVFWDYFDPPDWDYG